MTDAVRDRTLWRAGLDKIAWAERFMPVTRDVLGALGADGILAGRRVAIYDVLEPKTATLALGLAREGAEVTVASVARDTSDDVAAALDHEGVAVFARSDAGPAGDRSFALRLLDRAPEVLVDDGSSAIRLAHARRPEVLGTLVGASEQTTSGLRPLRLMASRGELRIPVLAAGDARTKALFDNAHGTGQAVLLAALDLLGARLAGRSVVIAGFGLVGRGLARHAAALGARVTVTETDPVAALEAVFAGFAVRPLAEAARGAELLVTATGIAHTVEVEHLLALPDGAAVAVGGGVDQEIALDDALAAGARREDVAPHVARLHLPTGRSVLVLDDGNCLNCSAAEGNPVEIMDLSFGVQAGAVGHLLRHGPGLAPGVHALPGTVDDRVARVALARLGAGLDRPNRAQREFLAEWRPRDLDPDPVTP